MKDWLGNSLNEKQKREMVRDYFRHLDNNAWSDPSIVKGALIFPSTSAGWDTLVWGKDSIFQTICVWLLVVLCCLFCLYILREMKKGAISILKDSLYLTFIMAMGVLISISRPIGIAIRLGDYRGLLLVIAIVILMLAFSLFVSMYLIRGSIVKARRHRMAKKQPESKAKGCALVFPAYIFLVIIYYIWGPARSIFWTVIFVSFFMIMAIFASVNGYLAFLIKKFDCADIKR